MPRPCSKGLVHDDGIDGVVSIHDEDQGGCSTREIPRCRLEGLFCLPSAHSCRISRASAIILPDHRSQDVLLSSCISEQQCCVEIDSVSRFTDCEFVFSLINFFSSTALPSLYLASSCQKEKTTTTTRRRLGTQVLRARVIFVDTQVGDLSMAARASPLVSSGGSAVRRRERRLRSFWRHEQMAIQMALAAVTHHSFQVGTAHDALRSQKLITSAGWMRPPPLVEGRPQERIQRQTVEQIADPSWSSRRWWYSWWCPF